MAVETTERHNLWLTIKDHSKIICYGTRSDMNDVALLAGIEGSVHVLPDGLEPNEPPTIN